MIQEISETLSSTINAAAVARPEVKSPNATTPVNCKTPLDALRSAMRRRDIMQP